MPRTAFVRSHRGTFNVKAVDRSTDAIPSPTSWLQIVGQLQRAVSNPELVTERNPHGTEYVRDLIAWVDAQPKKATNRCLSCEYEQNPWGGWTCLDCVPCYDQKGWDNWKRNRARRK